MKSHYCTDGHLSTYLPIPSRYAECNYDAYLLAESGQKSRMSGKWLILLQHRINLLLTRTTNILIRASSNTNEGSIVTAIFLIFLIHHY